MSTESYDVGYFAGRFLAEGLIDLITLKITLESVVMMLILFGIFVLLTESWKRGTNKPEPAPVSNENKKYCPACGMQMDVSAGYCPKCGKEQ